VDRCHAVRERLDYPALTTDVIIGFPGETDDDVEATCRVCEEVGFSKIHIFPFSARRGTPAADMPGQVPAEVKAARGRRLAELERELRGRYYKGLVGRRLDVLIEGPAESQGGEERGNAGNFTESVSLSSFGNRFIGTSCRYAPLDVSAAAGRVGELVQVTVGALSGEQLLGSAGVQR
jgi:threonylcarbamoyladenosine tRNA methylthiotransferase MtaB